MAWPGSVRPQRGIKNGSPKSRQIRDPGRPWQPSQNSQNTKKTLGKQGILGNVDILVATEIPRNLKTTGENKVFWSKMNSTWRRKSQKPLLNQCKMGYFVKKRGRPTGIPWPARGGEKKMGAAWRPWPGLAEAGLSGEKQWNPQKRAPVFSPAP